MKDFDGKIVIQLEQKFKNQADEEVDLKKLPSAKGIWAPCLTYCEAEDMFYVVYGVMNSMNARYFDVDNFLICFRDIKGPWSKPVYLHSSGFDASITAKLWDRVHCPLSIWKMV